MRNKMQKQNPYVNLEKVTAINMHIFNTQSQDTMSFDVNFYFVAKMVATSNVTLELKGACDCDYACL